MSRGCFTIVVCAIGVAGCRGATFRGSLDGPKDALGNAGVVLLDARMQAEQMEATYC